jgi:hypothetical protein
MKGYLIAKRIESLRQYAPKPVQTGIQSIACCLSMYFTLPHTLRLDSTWSPAESIWTPFSPGGVYLEYYQMYICLDHQAGVHLESTWSLHRLCLDSLKECCGIWVYMDLLCFDSVIKK